MTEIFKKNIKLSIFVMAGIVTLALVSASIMFNDQATTQVTESFIKSAPVMEVIEVENPNLEVLTFTELSTKEFDFIWRAINNGATYVSDAELKVYSEQIGEPNHRFVINDGDSVKYYKLSVSPPTLNYYNHYIKILEFAEDRNIDFKPLDSNLRLLITEHLDNPYSWIQIDEDTAKSFKTMMDADGTFFSSFNELGATNFQIMYLAPLKTVSVAPYVPDATPLHLQEHRSGIAVMQVIEVENPNLEVLTFTELSTKEFDFLWRAINNGATYVSDAELKVYSEQIGEPNHRFVINDGDSVKYYRLAIYTPPINYASHYIKILEFAEDRNIDFKPLDSNLRLLITEHLDDPYSWIQIDEDTAKSFKTMMDADGTFFSSFNKQGATNFQIMYLGPLGEEFQTDDFVEIRQSITEQQFGADPNE